MKTLKQFLDFMGSLVKAWPLLAVIIGLFLSLILGVSKWGRVPLQLSLPVWLAVIVGSLALYPILKSVEFLFNHSRHQIFEYAGLKWKPSLFRFQFPTPLCPICERGIVRKRIPPPPLQLTRDFSNIRASYSYEYECPIHGKLENVPNSSMEELQMKAKLVQKR